MTMQIQCITKAQPWQTERRPRAQPYQTQCRTRAQPLQNHRQNRFLAELNNARIYNRCFLQRRNINTHSNFASGRICQWRLKPMATASMTVLFQSSGAADSEGTCPPLGVEHWRCIPDRGSSWFASCAPCVWSAGADAEGYSR